MAREFWELIGAFFNKLVRSRLFPLAIIFTLLFGGLIGRLYAMQIVNGDKYRENYVQKTLATLDIPSVRGNIYDSKGNLLAGNEVVYDLVFRDTGAYRTHQAKNTAAREIWHLLQQIGEPLVTVIPIEATPYGFVWSTDSPARRRRFLIDLCGRTYIERRANNGEDVYAWTATQVIDYMKAKYYFDRWVEADKKTPVNPDNETALAVLNIRFKLTMTAYSKYLSISLASDLTDEAVAAAMEAASDITGLTVEQNYKRVYPYGRYCAALIGYTKSADEEELARLQELYPDAGYKAGDVIGVGGIEENMESYLQGRKGRQTVYLDSQGQILNVVERTEPEMGSSVYLTIDIEKVIGTYHLMERMLAGIILANLVDADEVEEKQNPEIPIRTVLINLISNNVVDYELFDRPDASEPEKRMREAFTAKRAEALAVVEQELSSPEARPYETLSENEQAYFDFLYSDLLQSWGIFKSGAIDRESEIYLAWAERSVTLQDFLRAAISNDWIETSAVNTDEKYANTDELYDRLLADLMGRLEESRRFDKLLYSQLITDHVISGNDITAALLYQGVLEHTDEELQQIQSGGREVVFHYLSEKIRSLELTPQQLALDPCSAAVVMTDVKTGKVLDMISYPGYDNNYFSGSIDATYYSRLIEDMSSPLYNRATQTTIAPGSTFKMISLIAGLQENVITMTEEVNCTGVYEKVTPSPSCWFLEGHGPEAARDAIADSCNIYFYEIGYRLSLDDQGQLNSAAGVEKLRTYAEMFGFSEKTGIELSESTPHISDREAIASAIGQGTHAYSTAALGRYATAIASRGNLYRLSLLGSVESADGTRKEVFEPEIVRTIELPDAIWDEVQTGMRLVMTEGSQSVNFTDIECFPMAGKSGTSQQDLKRSEHAHFISYAPFDNPEISLAVTIPNGYGSSFAALAANEIYKFWYGAMSYDEVMSLDAFNLGGAYNLND